ncbi:MAG: hypothetical protein CME62_03370 [Halobacteriovoraceae bacterium]|nr:hypothetical protein [Halobacteriovoraceae bacterium]|tara:strand:+ start:27073 stop:27666 length:594 start_codon:yes stop_codon:yes gene_type:complete
METLLVVLIIILLVFMIILLGVVGFLFFKYLKLNQSLSNPALQDQSKVSVAEDRMPDEVKKKIEQAKRQKQTMQGQFCVDHPENPAKGKCSISEEPYCELCITREKDVRISRKFLHLFLDSEWENLYFLDDDVVGSDALERLMKIKKVMWQEKGTPVIAQKQFKINIENDEIETFTVVMVRPEDKEAVNSKLSFLNQ